MSSHHFVKEDQEPALLIINPTAISFEKIQELLEWSPTVFVNAKALPTVLRWGIKIDVVICQDQQQESLTAGLADQMPIQFVVYSLGNHPLLIGLHHLNTKNYKAVNVLVDQRSDIDRLGDFSSMPIDVFADQKRWVYVRSGIFEKWLTQSSQVFVYPSVPMTTENLDQHLVVKSDGMVKLQSLQSFWVGEELV